MAACQNNANPPRWIVGLDIYESWSNYDFDGAWWKYDIDAGHPCWNPPFDLTWQDNHAPGDPTVPNDYHRIGQSFCTGMLGSCTLERLRNMDECRFELTAEGFLHCPYCNQADWPAVDPRGKPYHKVPADSALWPRRTCKAVVSPRERAQAERKRLAAGGPGDQLHLLILRWTGQDVSPGCDCLRFIAKMNAWGVEGCRRRIDRIVRHLLVEAHRRGLLESNIAAGRWAKRMGAKAFCRWLVKRAIRRARGACRNLSVLMQNSACAQHPFI